MERRIGYFLHYFVFSGQSDDNSAAVAQPITQGNAAKPTSNSKSPSKNSSHL